MKNKTILKKSLIKSLIPSFKEYIKTISLNIINVIANVITFINSVYTNMIKCGWVNNKEYIKTISQQHYTVNIIRKFLKRQVTSGFNKNLVIIDCDKLYYIPTGQCIAQWDHLGTLFIHPLIIFAKRYSGGVDMYFTSRVHDIYTELNNLSNQGLNINIIKMKFANKMKFTISTTSQLLFKYSYLTSSQIHQVIRITHQDELESIVKIINDSTYMFLMHNINVSEVFNILIKFRDYTEIYQIIINSNLLERKETIKQLIIASILTTK